MGKTFTKVSENRERNFRENQRSNSLAKLTGLGAVGVGVVGLVASQASGETIHSFSELFETGYTTQKLNNYTSGDFKVEGATPVLNYHFGFLDENGYVVGHLDSVSGYLNYLVGKYNGDPIYAHVLNVGEKPYSAIVIEDTNGNDVIADLTGKTLTIDSGDRVWFTYDIEFAGVKGAIEQMPAYMGTSDTLPVPSINLIPEPGTAVLLALGAGVLLGKKARGLVGKILGKSKK